MYDPHYYWQQLSESQKVYIYIYTIFLLHRRDFVGAGILIMAGIILAFL
jgi:hypothetical protein